MNWTKEQQEAIELRGKNILVSAAAGSGKTAVLVERIKRLILEEGSSIDRMLIVTFTNAAASEMKEKIRKAITAEAEKQTECSENLIGGKERTAFFKRQMNLLSTANISTFHSFALEVIRRYFYLIGIEPNFKICDSTQETLLRGEAMDQLLEELFEEGDERFFRFLQCYSGDRDESRFRELLNNCYNTIRSLPEPFAWVRKSVERLCGEDSAGGEKTLGFIFELAVEKLASAEMMIGHNRKIAVENSLEGLADLSSDDADHIDALKSIIYGADTCEDVYEHFREALGTFKLRTMSSKIFAAAENGETLKKIVTDNRNGAKKIVRNLKEVYFSHSIDSVCAEMAKTYDSALYTEELLKRYDSIYSLKKREKNLADFGDIEHYAYTILKNREAADFYRNRFEHIFIDEYQDSNVIQEALVDLIRRPDNLFMVGDIKQSIYKFRLAEPEIFQKKYSMYASGEEKNSVKIDLNKNFRSKQPIVDFINCIFENIMTGYDENAKLYAGNQDADMCCAAPKLLLTQVPWDENSEIDEELKNIIKAEKEAYAAAAVIRDSLGDIIFDSKRGMERHLEKRDIVILMRGVRNYGDIFYKILGENNIPAYIDDNDGFFDTMEINTFLSALYVIDNPKQDIHLLTLMRSEMLGFSIEEMAAIRIQFRESSYYDAFLSYAENGKDEELSYKCRASLEKIEDWQQLSKIMPLDKFVWKLMIDTGFYIAMGAMPSGSQRQANLRALTDKAGAYQAVSGSSLYGFIRYIEAVKEKKVTMGQVKLLGENDDLVRIMTVHKSKGLEFPMVILSGYCRKLNYSTAGKSPVFHKDLGMGFPIVDPKAGWYRTTLLQNMIKERFRKEEADEEKRILYVALTRAMDRLVLLGICPDIKKELDKISAKIPSNESYWSMTGRAIRENYGIGVIDDEKIKGLSKGKRRSIESMLHILDECSNIKVPSEIERMMNFRYPYEDDLKARSKYSVSDINSSGRRVIEDLKQPAFAEAKEKMSSMSRGTIYHAVLEHMNVASAAGEGESYILSLLKFMTEREIITPDEAEIIDVEKLKAFASSSIGKRIASAKRVEKEKRFNLRTEHNGSNVIIRGIIDCFFEEDDGIVLLDYKTGNYNAQKDDIKMRYGVQMELYGKALEAAYGKRVKEKYIYLTDSGRIVSV